MISIIIIGVKGLFCLGIVVIFVNKPAEFASL